MSLSSTTLTTTTSPGLQQPPQLSPLLLAEQIISDEDLIAAIEPHYETSEQRYLNEFRTKQCPLFVQHKCQQHRPFTCFNWHFANQRRRKPTLRDEKTFNYNPDIYCAKYNESTGYCSDGDECPFVHRTAGDTERRYHLRYYKTATCVHDTDTKGHCMKNGPHCAFAHGLHDLRQPVFDANELKLRANGEEKEKDKKESPEEKEVIIDDIRWRSINFVLANYKTELCKKPPRQCRQGYACPMFHNQKDKRRSPIVYKYRSTPCPSVKHGDEWGDPSHCEHGEKCGYCHTRTEQQFHPEVYKSSKCNDMINSGHCPRGPFCAFAHSNEEADKSSTSLSKLENTFAHYLGIHSAAEEDDTIGKNITIKRRFQSESCAASLPTRAIGSERTMEFRLDFMALAQPQGGSLKDDSSMWPTFMNNIQNMPGGRMHPAAADKSDLESFFAPLDESAICAAKSARNVASSSSPPNRQSESLSLDSGYPVTPMLSTSLPASQGGFLQRGGAWAAAAGGGNQKDSPSIVQAIKESHLRRIDEPTLTEKQSMAAATSMMRSDRTRSFSTSAFNTFNTTVSPLANFTPDWDSLLTRDPSELQQRLLKKDEDLRACMQRMQILEQQLQLCHLQLSTGLILPSDLTKLDKRQLGEVYKTLQKLMENVKLNMQMFGKCQRCFEDRRLVRSVCGHLSVCVMSCVAESCPICEAGASSPTTAA